MNVIANYKEYVSSEDFANQRFSKLECCQIIGKSADELVKDALWNNDMVTKSQPVPIVEIIIGNVMIRRHGISTMYFKLTAKGFIEIDLNNCLSAISTTFEIPEE